ncbi:hypothetical protein M3Y97_00026100 [Aphelenchoides bicaudatus]|nr:hypothetical protein M3Y97_00026100 [Aphelenchoides bicaudatus]
MKRTECAKLKEQIARLEKEIAKTENSTDKNSKLQNTLVERSEQFSKLQSERSSKTDALKQKLFSLDVFPDVSTEVGDIESVATRLDDLYISQTSSFKDFIKETVGEKAVLSENVRRDLNERKAQFEEAQNEMKQAFQAIQPLKIEHKTVEDQLKAFNDNVETERKMINDKIQRMQHVSQQLSDVEKKLSSHEKEVGPQNADECREKLQTVEEKLEKTKAESIRLGNVISECDNQSQTIQRLEGCLRIFDTQELISKLEGDIERIRQSLTQSSREINIEVQKVARQVSNLSDEMNKKRGARGILQTTEKELRGQLKGEKIEEVKNKLKQKVIERVSMETAIQDLRNLSKVMDDCIIQYHAQKMEQINQILNELWPRVYQGNDIETIQIRSQSAVGNDKRKSYDYSVIMIIDQVEIEMRDRCSAGQKMLASMLIRIALAEVFGGNCPILALDEPTTNLDALKVENMGTMLKDLLDACQNRENHHNLQLIVITHDRRLVEHLFTACRPEYVYGLSKGEDGSSRIRLHRNIAVTSIE